MTKWMRSLLRAGAIASCVACASPSVPTAPVPPDVCWTEIQGYRTWVHDGDTWIDEGRRWRCVEGEVMPL